MKSILLTSTALVAFAGAAAADGHTSVSLGGEASAEYNSYTNFGMETEITATGTADLDNGLTAEASLTFTATDDDAGTFDAGSISVSSSTASVSLGYGLDGALYNVFEDDYLSIDEEQVDGVTGYAEFGSTTLYVSAAIAGQYMGAAVEDEDLIDTLEVAIASDIAGWSLGVGATGASDAAASLSGTVAGFSIGLGGSTDEEYDASIEYTISPVTVGVSTDEGEEFTLNVDFESNGISAGVEYVTDETWEVSAGYDANGVVLEASYNSAELIVLDGTYDMGNGLVLGAGMSDDGAANPYYVFGEYDLGGGASFYVDWAETDNEDGLVEVGPSERDIARGTTVGLSFEF